MSGWSLPYSALALITDGNDIFLCQEGTEYESSQTSCVYEKVEQGKFSGLIQIIAWETPQRYSNIKVTNIVAVKRPKYFFERGLFSRLVEVPFCRISKK